MHTGATSGNSASLWLQVSQYLVRQMNIKDFLGDILTNTSPIGGQDTSIVIRQVAVQDIEGSWQLLVKVMSGSIGLGTDR